MIVLSQAITAKDFGDAKEEFTQIGDYEDSCILKAECAKQQAAILRHRKLKIQILSGLAMLIVIVAIFLQLPIGRYYKANAFMKVKCYGQAAKTYESLGKYKDSHVRYKECEYQEGLILREKKDYSEAKRAFECAGNRKDSENYLVEMQKKVGDKIKIGNSTWYI